jgi:hypothetical protein
MLKLIALVIVEIVVGIAAAAGVLAVLIPQLIRHQIITPGSDAGAAVIGAVIVLAIGIMLFRPGSVLHRRRE